MSIDHGDQKDVKDEYSATMKYSRPCNSDLVGSGTVILYACSKES